MSGIFLNYKQLCVLSCFLFFISIKSFSQKGFSPGYIVSATDDTIQVKIKLNNLDQNQCIYIDSAGKNFVGGPETVKAFSVSDGRTFRYLFLDKIKNAVNAYMEVLVDGKICLYAFKDRYFTQKDNGDTYELLSTEESGVNKEGANYIRKKKEYIGLLKFLLSDAKTAMPDIMRLDFTRKELTKIIRIYNEGETYIQELDRQRYKPNFRFGLEALLASDNYKFRFPSDSFVDEYEGQFMSPGIGGTVKYQFSKYLSINSGLRFKYLDYSIYKSYGVEFSKRYYTLKNNFLALSLPVTVDCQFDKLPLHPYAGLGFQFEKSFLKNSSCLEEANTYSATDFYTYIHQTNFLTPVNFYWIAELGGSSTFGKLSVNLKAQYLMDISIINSKEESQFYHKSGLQFVLGVMF